MTYHAGLSPTAAAFIGRKPCGAHITCDGCGTEKSIYTKWGGVTAWWMNAKPAPGWMSKKRDDFTRFDLCPTCKHLPEKQQ